MMAKKKVSKRKRKPPSNNPGGRKPQVTVKRVLAAIPGTMGIKSTIAKKLGVGRSALTKFLSNRITVETRNIIDAELVAESEKMVDMSEHHLATVLNMGNATKTKLANKSILQDPQIIREKTKAAIFLCKTRGRDRGYVEKKELELSGQVGVKGYEVVSPDDFPTNKKPKKKTKKKTKK